MSNFGDKDYLLEVARGEITGESIVTRVGRNDAASTTLEPISAGGIYRTPQVAAATALRVKAGNTNDTAAGTGARSVILIGLDETGAQVTETIATAGVSASADSANTYIRLLDAIVGETGTYSDLSAGSHAADVVIENAAGTQDWGTLLLNGFAKSTTEVSSYTVPLGKTAFFLSATLDTESSKTTSILFMQRRDILDAAAPYSPLISALDLGVISGGKPIEPKAPVGPFPALTDLVVLARVATGTGDVDFSVQYILIDE